MTHLSNDELLLNRYVDGEVSPEERETIENRLAAEPELRAQLADLVSFSASLGIGLAGTPVGEALPTTSAARTRDGHRRGFSRVPWVRRHPLLLPAAAVVCISAVVAGALWIDVRGSSATSARNPYKVLAELDSRLDKAALHSDLEHIVDPATSLEQRQEILRSWADLDRQLLEPLVWAVAPLQKDACARRTLFIALPRGAVRDYPALLGAARAEWSARALDPLSQLVTHLSFHRVAETEQFYAEILRAREDVKPEWFAQRLPTIVEAFPTSLGPQVASLLKDPDEFVRAWAGLARAAVGQRDGIECAQGLLQSSSRDVRVLAVTTIDRHGTGIDVPQLAPMVNDPAESVRRAAREAFKSHRLPVPPSSFNP